MKTNIFIFRRDFRLGDNTGLIELCKLGKPIMLIFIFTPEQIGSGNMYRSVKAIQFMLWGLRNIPKLNTFYGDNVDVLDKLRKQMDIECIYENEDYTPYAHSRTQAISKWAEKHAIIYKTFSDYTLSPFPEKPMGGSGSYYSKYTYYYGAASQYKVRPVSGYRCSGFIPTRHSVLDKVCKKFGVVNFPDVSRVLSTALKSQRNYKSTRDIPAIPTSGLSQYIKFGIVSIRKVYHLFRKNKDFIKQLYWRDFYFQIAYYKPDVLAKPGTANRNYYSKYNKLSKYTHLRTLTVKKKIGGEAAFKAWCTGKTPEPLVNAGIKELLTTGRMHNRVRMIVASYLIKDLGWSWEDGEKFFANHLIDYDPAVNNGNWQFINGSGASAMMLSRKFSPERQTKQYDPDGLYIRKYP